MKQNKLKDRGFTLIELLVVIVIIATLSAMGGAAYMGAQKSTLKKKNITMLNQIANSIESYHLDFGAYPEAGDPAGANSVRLFECLFEGASPDGTVAGTSGKITNYAPYLDPEKGNSIIDGTTGEILDPYDNPYLYLDGRSHAGINNPDFDLWSLGADGEDDVEGGVSDNIANW